MRVADIVEVESPVFVRLIGQILWLAGNGVNLTSCSSDFLDDAFVNVAP